MLISDKSRKHRWLVVMAIAFAMMIGVICISALDIEIPQDSDEDRTERATVTVIVGGYEYATCNSPIMTVGELISKIGIELDENSVIDKNESDIIKDGMTITVGRYTKETYTEYEEIPFVQTYIDSQTVPKGKLVLNTEGENGKAVVTHEITYIDGVFYSDKRVDENVIKEPTEEVYYRGVGGTVTAEDGTSYDYSYYIDVVATAYHTGGVTATGKEATDGIIAVDPRVISYGTKVFVTGKYGEIGVCSAEDTGGGIKGNRIDICMSGTTAELLQFGRRNMRVYILE